MKQLPYQKTVLPSGTRLILVPMRGVNSIATSVMVGVGGRYEDPAVNGISHFLEHMVFKGTKKYPTTDDVNVIERQGGLQNAYTDIDITNYHNKTLSTDWRLALEINKELALAPLLEQKHIDKERDVIIQELKRYEDEPAAKVEEVFHEMLYPGTKLGMPVIGTEKSLRGVASKELQHYHDAWYRPERTIVVIAGKLDESTIFKIEKQASLWFDHELKINKIEGYENVKERQTEPKVRVTTKKEAQQAHLVLGLRTFGRASEDRFAWNVFNLLMGVGFTSRLFRQIREKRGLCYHIRSGSSNYQDVGYWSIYAGVATDKVEETIRAVMGELALAREKGISEKEIAVSKKRLKTMVAFKAEDPEFLNEYYGRQELFGMPIMTLEEYLSAIDKVTKYDIERCLARYFVTKNINLSLVWSKPEDSSLEKLLHIE